MSMNIGLSAVRLDQARTDLQTLAWQAGNGNASLPGETFTTGAGKTYFDGVPVAVTTGAVSSYFSTPDKAALNAAGDLVIEFRHQFLAYSAFEAVIAQGGNTGADYSYLILRNSDYLYFYKATAGGAAWDAVIGVTSPIAALNPSLAPMSWRVTYSVSTGAVTFEYKISESAAWASVATTGTPPVAGELHDTSSPLYMGAFNFGGFFVYPLLGKTYSLTVTKGGTLVSSFNPASYVSGTTWTASTGEVWTINGNASVLSTVLQTAKTNSILQSELLSDAAWAKDTTVAQNAVGRNGQANQAWTVTDSSAAAFQYLAQLVAIPNDSNTHLHTMWIAKTSGGTSKTCGCNLAMSGGTLVGSNWRLNTDTGVLLLGPVTTVTSDGAFWRVDTVITNNASGNTLYSAYFYPALSANNVLGDTVTETGSAVVDGFQLCLNTSVYPGYQKTGATACGFPRLEKDPATGLWCRLVEPLARTNKLPRSNNFGAAAWGSVNGASAAQNITGLDGTTSAWTVTDANGAATAYYQVATATLSSSNETYTWYIKKTSGAQSSYPVLLVTDSGSGRLAACTVDTSNGVATVWTAHTGWTVTTSSAACVSAGTDFWRVSLTFLANGVAWLAYVIPACTANPTKATGHVFDEPALTGSAVFTNGQLESGSSPTSYINNNTDTTTTLDADVLTVPVSGNLTNAAGFAAMSFTPTRLDPTFPDAGCILSSYTGTGGMPIRDFGGVGMFDTTNNLTFLVGALSAGSRTRWATTWSGSTCNGAANGVIGTQQAFDGDMGLGASIRIGDNISGLAIPVCLRLHSLTLGTRRLTNSELSVITA
jgi:hypothetical protein